MSPTHSSFIIGLLVLVYIEVSGYADVGGGGDVDARGAGKFLDERGVPQARAHTDGAGLHAAQLVDHTLELDAFCGALLAVLEYTNEC